MRFPFFLVVARASKKKFPCAYKRPKFFPCAYKRPNFFIFALIKGVCAYKKLALIKGVRCSKQYPQPTEKMDILQQI